MSILEKLSFTTAESLMADLRKDADHTTEHGRLLLNAADRIEALEEACARLRWSSYDLPVFFTMGAWYSSRITGQETDAELEFVFCENEWRVTVGQRVDYFLTYLKARQEANKLLKVDEEL